MPSCILAALVALLGSLGPAGAVEFKHREPLVQHHDCTCRFHGENVPLAQRRCLDTPEGPRMAQCVMEQNVTSWRTGHDLCPQASRVTPRA